MHTYMYIHIRIYLHRPMIHVFLFYAVYAVHASIYYNLYF